MHPSLDGQHSRIEIERQRYGNSTNLALHANARKTYASLTLANPSPVVAVPCVNITGYLSYRRQFRDGHDLNRTFPGRPGGFASQVFCHQLLEKLIRHFNYHIDLHTASFGRINSYYIRADMLDPVTAEMSLLCNPQIILHNSGQDGTLRGAATQLGIKSITVEIGNPQSLQSRFISWYVPALATLRHAETELPPHPHYRVASRTYAGTRRIMSYLNMYPLQNVTFSKKPPNKQNIILCSNGFWMYTNYGGVLEGTCGSSWRQQARASGSLPATPVYPPVNSIVQEGDLIARVKNIFGNIVEEIFAPCKGVCIGRSSNPVAYTGDRIIHLGVRTYRSPNTGAGEPTQAIHPLTNSSASHPVQHMTCRSLCQRHRAKTTNQSKHPYLSMHRVPLHP